jgi:ABC-type antimicrobial peptide transport system permease subunit
MLTIKLFFGLIDNHPQLSGYAATVISFFAWSASKFGYMAMITPYLQDLVLLGSFSASVCTCYYLLKKAKKLDQPKDKQS